MSLKKKECETTVTKQKFESQIGTPKVCSHFEQS